MLNSTLPSLFFDVTSLQIFNVKLVSMLQFSMLPYSMLPSSIPTFQLFYKLKFLSRRYRLKNRKSLIHSYRPPPNTRFVIFASAKLPFPAFYEEMKEGRYGPLFIYMTSYFCESRSKRMMTSCRFHQHLTISFLIAKMFWQLFCAYSYCACNF